MSESDYVLAAAERILEEDFGGENIWAEDPVGTYVEPEEAPVQPDTPELTFDATGRAHGPDGKFVSQEGDASAEEAAGEPEVAEVEPETDPSAEAVPTDDGGQDPPEDNVLELDAETLGIGDDHPLFTKYGGDLSKALEALDEAQRRVGERAHEVGNLRAENESLNQLLQEMATLRAQVTPYQNDLDEDPKALVMEVLQRTAETGYFDEGTYQRALSTWGEEEPFEAANLNAQVQMAKMAAKTSAPEAESSGPDLAEEVDAFKERHPDFQQLLPAINTLAEQRPLLQRSLYEGSPQERAQALEDLYELAKSRSNQTATSEAAKKVILRARVEADKAKSDAAVVGASRTSAVELEKPITGDRLLEQALRELSGLEDFVVVE